MPDWNTITSYPALVVLLMVMRGSAPVAFRLRASPARDYCAAVFCLATAFALRTAYWDILMAKLSEMWAERVSGWVQGTEINTLFNVLVIAGCLFCLHGLYLGIPDSERHKWSMWSAWFYPGRLWRKR